MSSADGRGQADTACTGDVHPAILPLDVSIDHPATSLTLDLLDGLYAVCRLGPDKAVPAWAWTGPFASVTRTPAELSIVCAESAVPDGQAHVERGFRALGVVGPLDFNIVGVMARLTAPLAEAEISILALATYDTDYLLVRAADLPRAIAALHADGHTVRRT